jgi:hypothetical protein
MSIIALFTQLLVLPKLPPDTPFKFQTHIPVTNIRPYSHHIQQILKWNRTMSRITDNYSGFEPNGWLARYEGKYNPSLEVCRRALREIFHASMPYWDIMKDRMAEAVANGTFRPEAQINFDYLYQLKTYYATHPYDGQRTWTADAVRGYYMSILYMVGVIWRHIE